jgi:acyl homoserine lactone synthase
MEEKMIIIVNDDNKQKFAHLVDQMYVTRAKVFGERLGWDVSVNNGQEKDVFDEESPTYLISTDHGCRSFYGSVRLLPTTGPNMLRDVFSCLLDGEEPVESPLIWESSRFSINPEITHAKKHDQSLVNTITYELLLGLTEFGIKSGIKFIVSVYDARMARIFKTAKCESEIIGTPQRIGKVKAYAGLFATDQRMISKLSEAASITHPVLHSRFYAA